jgi:hypothetical protein
MGRLVLPEPSRKKRSLRRGRGYKGEQRKKKARRWRAIRKRYFTKRRLKLDRKYNRRKEWIVILAKKFKNSAMGHLL